MRRADRLFQIVQLIRGRRLSTAAYLAQRLEVSERTVYRDIADLQHQGVPIEGEAGVGYRLGVGFDLPPLMFTEDEARALVASVRMAQVWQDPALAQASLVALGKILSVLPAWRTGGCPKHGHLRTAQRAGADGAGRPANLARSSARSSQDSDGVPRCQRADDPTNRAPTGLLLLGQGLDAGGLV
jgi:biotin operon repressor